MIHVSVTYPNQADATFDHDYYRDKHFALVRARLGPALQRAEIDRALAGGQPGEPPALLAVGHLYFASLEDVQAALGTHGAELMGDIPNFTNVQPQVVISESTPA